LLPRSPPRGELLASLTLGFDYHVEPHPAPFGQ